MKNPARFMTRVCLFACASILIISCKDTDEFLSENGGSTNLTEANTFDFSTTKTVDLVVDYSDYETYGPVLFSIYPSNPIVNEGTLNEYVDESFEPIFEGYTDKNGKFDATISLPSYARVLHIVTGDLFIGLKRVAVEVVNGEAKVKVSSNKPATSRVTRAKTFTGESTNNLTHSNSNLYNLWNAVDKQYNPGNIYMNGDNPYARSATASNPATQICKEWHTPLGTWNSASGRPDYVKEKASDAHLQTLFGAIKTALSKANTCRESYRAGADLMLLHDSEVSITALGSYTWWNSSLGYYYYSDESPTNLMDIDIIMIYPNTQDGKRDASWDYQNNVGMDRGDVIQLMYYPNIANNGDLSGATTYFPKGTKIGFVLKTNAWGMIDVDHSIEYVSRQSNGLRRYNVWATSTEGLSFAAINSWHTGDFSKPNPNRESRTAKFSYEDGNDKYTIISFEDACNNKTYDDVVFALNPANAFTEQPKLEQGKTTSHGVYAFEDMWPAQGDYDMNDVMVDFVQEAFFYYNANNSNDSNNGKINKQVVNLITYQNYVTATTGLAVRLNTKSRTTPTSVVMKKKAPGQTEAITVEFEYDGEAYYLTEDIKGEIGTSYVFEMTYATPQAINKLAEVQPFIYRKESNGKQWELHIPYEAPTSKMNRSYFGTANDASVTSAGKYYVRQGDYPFAYYLDNAKIDYFFDNILLRDNENKPIDTFFSGFIEWSKSKGKTNADWYLHPNM